MTESQPQTWEQESEQQRHSGKKLHGWWHRLAAKEQKLLIRLGICLAAGITLMYAGSLGLGAGHTSSDVAERQQQEELSTTAESEVLEQKLADILSQVKGAGQVSVAVEYSESAAAVYATDREISEDEDGSSRQEQESLTLAGDAPVLIKQQTPQLRGVLVVASGAGDVLVRERLLQAVKGLLGLEAAQIAIIEGEYGMESTANSQNTEGSESDAV